jgi:hypothetical protein
MPHHDHRIEGIGTLDQAEPSARACAREEPLEKGFLGGGGGEGFEPSRDKPPRTVFETCLVRLNHAV